MDAGELERACVLCRGTLATRINGALRCRICGWRVGDVPDPDVPVPRVDVVYYVQFDSRIKIGTSARPRQRLSAIRHHELLAFEPGDRLLERSRHEQFAHLRLGGEWFDAAPELLSHTQQLRGETEPWHAYARWFADALARVMP